MDITLRPVTEAELDDFRRATGVAFGSIGGDDDFAVGPGLDVDRSLAGFDGTEIVATAAALSFELTVPGHALVPTAGVTMVGVHPTHRRRGLLVRMMEEQLADVAARSEPLAVLTASESAIYGRFGYGLATFSTFWSLRTEGTTFARPSTAGGQFRLLDPATARSTVVPPLYDAARKRHVGEVTRSAKWFEHTFGDRPDGKDPGARSPWCTNPTTGTPTASPRYRIKDEWPGGIAANTLEVLDLYALDDEVEAALWQFLVDIDLVANVKGIGRPIDEPLRWRLADPRRLQIDPGHRPPLGTRRRSRCRARRAHVLVRRPPRHRAHRSVPPCERGALVDRGLGRRRGGSSYRRRTRSRAVGAGARRSLPRRRVGDDPRSAPTGSRRSCRVRSSAPTASSPARPRRGAARISSEARSPLPLDAATLSCMIASIGPGSTSLSSAR